MALKLTVISSQRFAPGQVAAKLLEAGRLTIGRGADRDWMLPDPERVLSKEHCFIEGAGGSFRLTDTSANGTFAGADEQPIGPNNSRVLRDGERIRMGAYEIAVEITDAEAAARAGDATGLGLDFTSAASLFADRSPHLSADPFANAGARLPRPDYRDPFADAAPRRRGAPRPLADLEYGAPIDRPFEPPRAATRAAPAVPDIPEDWAAELAQSAAPLPRPDPEIPEDWDEPTAKVTDPFAAVAGPLADPFAAAPPVPQDEPSSPRPVPMAVQVAPKVMSAAAPGATAAPAAPSVPAPSAAKQCMASATVAVAPPAAPTTSGDTAALLAAFLDGAGLKPENVVFDDPAATLRTVGAMWRVAVHGIIEILESRHAIKSEFRLSVTEFKRAENNPLKFSLGVEETLRILLSRPECGYLPAADALVEALADIREHQVAVLAGMQEAWCDLLRRLDPQALQKRLGEDSGLGGLLTSKKARCWDAFTELYASVAEDGGRGVESLFDRKFAEGYERQSGKRPGG